MKNLLKRFAKDQSGATAIEYGLIAAGIAAVIIVSVQALGSNVNTTFNNIANSMTPSSTGTGTPKP
jgi:pilus assembly protein Flp/PilA